ncbi:MAG TPA: mycothiol system anti-sigma-R factor [Ilumatobacteraceae bacterium]|nr:mycothiol system anti-sigma-R factor [Ilumatobacteraceae bacterium]
MTEQSDPYCADLVPGVSGCEETLRELERFLDRELTDVDRVSIFGHLDGCPDCLQTYDFHAELKMVIAAKCRNDQMPAGLMDKIERCFGDMS